MSKELIEYFNRKPRIGMLATANKKGEPNIACFGSPRMVDEKTVLMGLQANRSLTNLQENAWAVFMIVAPAETLSEWRGVRTYLKMVDCQTSGAKLQALRDEIAATSGKAAADTLHAAVSFEIQEVRPIVDFGQGWENSI